MALPEEQKGYSSRPLSIRAFADLAETSPRRIRRLIHQGRLRTTTNSAGEIRIPESELSRLEGEKQRRLLKQSMELAPVSASLEVSPDFDGEGGPGALVSLQRHEAAMVRLGFIESELASSRRMLQEAAQRQDELETRADEAEQDAVAATVRAVEAETALEEMRSQVIDSTFRAMELEKQVEELQEEAQKPWWKKIFPGKDSGEAGSKK
ncbi:MAG: hypothetical protein WC314_03700 [Vulcanimicrobiota bacterium]